MDLRSEYTKTQRDITDKLDILKKMRKTCERQKRLPTDAEADNANKMLSEIDKLEERQAEIEAMPDAESEYKTPIDSARDNARTTYNVGYEARNFNQEKRFSDLYGKGKNPYEWRDKEANFYQALFSGRFHPELTKRAMNEGIPSDGGFLVPIQYSKDIHNVALENEIILPRCQVQPMTTNEIRLPAMEIGDHSSNLFGGFTASWTAEAGTLTDANPKARMMELNAKKLTGFIRASNELISDMNGPERLSQIAGKGLGFYRDAAFIGGTGAGQPQGLMSAACRIEVEKETGQAADTIVLENLNKMLSRLYQGGFKNAVWIVSQTALPQLLQLSLSVGTGGSASLVMSERDGIYKIYGKEVIFSEHMEEVGTAGDILLTDLSQYIVGLKEEIRVDVSPHLYFDTDEIAMRLISRIDGQSLWGEALTLKGSGTTVSPVISLAERV